MIPRWTLAAVGLAGVAGIAVWYVRKRSVEGAWVPAYTQQGALFPCGGSAGTVKKLINPRGRETEINLVTGQSRLRAGAKPLKDGAKDSKGIPIDPANPVLFDECTSPATREIRESARAAERAAAAQGKALDAAKPSAFQQATSFIAAIGSLIPGA